MRKKDTQQINTYITSSQVVISTFDKIRQKKKGGGKGGENTLGRVDREIFLRSWHWNEA